MPSEQEARFMLDFAHEAASQGDYDIASYTSARDAYRDAVSAATLAEVRGVVEGVPTHEDTPDGIRERTAIAFATDLLRSLDRLNGEAP